MQNPRPTSLRTGLAFPLLFALAACGGGGAAGGGGGDIIAAPVTGTAPSTGTIVVTPPPAPVVNTGNSSNNGDGAVPASDGAIDVTVTPVVDAVKEVVTPVVDAVKDVVAPVVDAVKDVVAPVVDTVVGVVAPVVDTVVGVVTPVVDAVKDVVTPVVDTVTDVVAPIVDAVSGAIGAVIPTTPTPVTQPTPEPTPTPTPTPSPTPTPTPVMTMPTPAATAVPSPSLSGLDPVASGIDVSKYLAPSWGTGEIPIHEEGEGAFRFVCTPSHNAYDDPIVYPGQPGKSHLHTFFGNTGANANSTYQSLRTSGESTCNNLLNRSAYWIPALMNGRGKVVMPDYVAIYYKGLPSTDPICKQLGKGCIQLPRGLRYIFGYNMSDPSKSSPPESMWWNCDYPYAGGHFPNLAQAAIKCPSGARIGMVMTGPGCWNGTQLDSPDHRSHLAYSYYENGVGRCPKTHPYVIPHFTIGAWYTTDDTLDRSGNESPDAKTWYLASDRMPGMPNSVPGTTMHSDWFGAWEDSILTTWASHCIENMLNCSGGDLGNGKQMRVMPVASATFSSNLVDIPPR